MFSSVFSFIAEMGHEESEQPDPPIMNEDGTMEEPTDWSTIQHKQKTCYAVAVGKKPSHASMYVTDAKEVANALVLLAKKQQQQYESRSSQSMNS
eukprot:scaffold3337_cov95-Cylindrotheca_fusiformis.AAC.7